MSLSLQIQNAERDLVEIKDQLKSASLDLEAAPESDSFLKRVEDLSDRVAKTTIRINKLKESEKALMKKAVPIGGQAPGIIDPMHRGTNLKNAKDIIIKAATAEIYGYAHRMPSQMALTELYGDGIAVEQAKQLSQIIQKATSAPALSTSSTWAGELLRESVEAFMDLLKPVSVLPMLGLKALDLSSGSVRVPMRSQSGGNTMDAHFRLENEPIRVASTTLTSYTLTAKSAGVIGSFSREIAQFGTVADIESLIVQFITQDSAEALDRLFLSNSNFAPAAASPSGIRANLGTDAFASNGSGVANVMLDIKQAMGKMQSANMGSKPYWIMPADTLISLQTALTATGVPAFADTRSGVLMGIPIISSTLCPSGIVLLIDAAQIGLGLSPPAWSISDSASLHFEDTTPLPIVDGAGTTAKPVMNLFQQNLLAVRMVYFCNWVRLRNPTGAGGSVIEINTVAW